MIDFVSTLVSGVLTGAVWALLALAFVVVFRSTDVFNFATPQVGVVAAFFALVTLVGAGVPIVLAVLAAMALAAVLSLAIERVCIRPLGPGSLFAAVVVTFGLAIVLEALIAEIWGHDPRRVEPLIAGNVVMGDVVISKHKLLTFGIAVVVMIVMALFFRLTRTGVAMLAAAADDEAARVVGIDTIRVGQYAWAMGGALAALAAVLLAGQTFLSASLLAHATVLAFASMFLGGLTSMGGVVIGGFAIGLLENFASQYISVGFTTTTVVLLVLVMLLLRPAGLFGASAAVRV